MQLKLKNVQNWAELGSSTQRFLLFSIHGKWADWSGLEHSVITPLPAALGVRMAATGFQKKGKTQATYWYMVNMVNAAFWNFIKLILFELDHWG